MFLFRELISFFLFLSFFSFYLRSYIPPTVLVMSVFARTKKERQGLFLFNSEHGGIFF